MTIKAKPIAGAKRRAAKLPGLDKLTDEPCETCGKPVRVIVVQQGKPYFCNKACAGLPDRPPGSKPFRYDALNGEADASDADLEAIAS
jgi:hypothetical protein